MPAHITEPHPFTTVALPDGIVVGGPWPHTTVAWPGGKGRGATKPEYDLFQALETAVAENATLKAELLSLYGGERVILPANAEHAKAMAGIATSYLNGGPKP